MHESLKLFNSIANNNFFINTSLILFLNKKDIFAKKIKKYPLTVCFPEYDGDDTFTEALMYIKEKFENQRTTPIYAPAKQIYTHETCSVDTDNIRFVLESVMSIIVRTNLANIGLV